MRWVEIVLEMFVSDLEVKRWHGVIITIVAVARVNFVDSWIVELCFVHLVACVGGNHESIHKVVIEEFRELKFTVIGVDGHVLLGKLLLHRRDIVLHLQHDVLSFVVKNIDERLRGVGSWESVVFLHSIVDKADCSLIFVAISELLPVIGSTTDAKGSVSIESIRLIVALIALSSRIYELVQELSLN